MKKDVIILLGILILSLGLVSAKGVATCNDTDGSPTAYTIQGNVSGQVLNMSNPGGYSHYSYVDSCNSTVTPSRLVEYGCSGQSPTSTQVNCATVVGVGSTCSYGVCTSVTPSLTKPSYAPELVGSSFTWLWVVLGVLVVVGVIWYYSQGNSRTRGKK